MDAFFVAVKSAMLYALRILGNVECVLDIRIDALFVAYLIWVTHKFYLTDYLPIFNHICIVMHRENEGVNWR